MHISEINIYPIKSLKGISVGSSLVEERGLQHDRRWMLTTPDGMFFTQREFPVMALIAVEVTSDGLQVTSEAAGKMGIPFEPDKGGRKSVQVWQSVCEGLVYNGEVSEWFSDAIGTDCRLVYMPDNTRRSVNPRFNKGDDVVSFADGYPFMVLGEASLADLNEKLAKNAEKKDASGTLAVQSLPMNRFRPNLVVSDAKAFGEDEWEKVRIGDAIFRATKPCERCVVTTVDQARGEFAGKEPLKTLASYRRAMDVIPDRYELLDVKGTAVLFGQNLIGESIGGTVRVGDELIVLS